MNVDDYWKVVSNARATVAAIITKTARGARTAAAASAAKTASAANDARDARDALNNASDASVTIGTIEAASDSLVARDIRAAIAAREAAKCVKRRLKLTPHLETHR